MQQAIDVELVKKFLQSTTVAVSVDQNITSITAADAYNIPVPAVVPENMNIAVLPTTNSEDKFWLAIVTGLHSEQPLAYTICYYQ